MITTKKPKHAILADLEAIKPSPQAQTQIADWFKQRDYYSLDNLSTQTYAREIELRLHLLQALTFNRLYVTQATGLEQSYWQHSCSSINASLTQLESKEYRQLNNFVMVEKPAHLPFIHAAAEQFQEPPPDFKENMTLPEIDSYSNQLSVALSRQEFLCPLREGDKRVLISVDLTANNQTILDELLLELDHLRAKMAIPEPAADKSVRNYTAIEPFITHHAIAYLDLLIYCIQPIKTKAQAEIYSKLNIDIERPESGQYWNLTDNQIAQLINPLELDAEYIKKSRARFIEQKLFDGDYMRQFFLNLSRTT